jgi:hypothetical protein
MTRVNDGCCWQRTSQATDLQRAFTLHHDVRTKSDGFVETAADYAFVPRATNVVNRAQNRIVKLLTNIETDAHDVR